jgi:hypothetical protein
MVLPAAATIASGVQVAGQGARDLSSFMEAAQKGKLGKGQIKEKKRKTLAELLNAALNREAELGEGIRNRGADFSRGRANALQNVASQYVQALR